MKKRWTSSSLQLREKEQKDAKWTALKTRTPWIAQSASPGHFVFAHLGPAADRAREGGAGAMDGAAAACCCCCSPGQAPATHPCHLYRKVMRPCSTMLGAGAAPSAAPAPAPALPLPSGASSAALRPASSCCPRAACSSSPEQGVRRNQQPWPAGSCTSGQRCTGGRAAAAARTRAASGPHLPRPPRQLLPDHPPAQWGPPARCRRRCRHGGAWQWALLWQARCPRACAAQARPSHQPAHPCRRRCRGAPPGRGPWPCAWL